MNIHDEIVNHLMSKCCNIREDYETGIMQVHTPTGEVWDFTIPMLVEPSQIEADRENNK